MSGESLSEIASRITGHVGEVFNDFERMKEPRAEEMKSVSLMIPARGKRALKEICFSWGISESSLVRIALRELLERYEYNASGILRDLDRNAISRVPGARRPLLTSKEAKMKRRRPLVFAKHHGGDDPQES